MNPDHFKILRHFNAPRHAVFNAFVDEGAFARWFGPEYHRVGDWSLDPTPGGLIRIVMKSPGGAHNSVVGQYSIVDPDDHIAFTLATYPIPGGEHGFECSIAVTLSGNNPTKTELRYELLKAKPEFLDAAQASREGWEQSLDRLKDVLEGR